jgi:hypothetical protein
MGGTPNYTYQWLFANVVMGTNASYTPTQNGDYTVVVTDANGCVDSSDVFTFTSIPSSIAEHLIDNLRIYPNPFTDQTTINFLNPSDVIVEIALFDPTGRKVKNLKLIKNKQSIILEKGNLASGMYMLLIRTENYTSKSKLIIR